MSHKNLIYIVVVMSLAMFGLLALQFYWINSSLNLSEDAFKRSVLEVLENTARRLEYREVLSVTEENINNRVDVGSEFHIKIDSAGQLQWKENQTITTKQVLSNTELADRGLEIEFQEEAVISKSGFARRRNLGEVYKVDLPGAEFSTSLDSADFVKSRPQRQFIKAVNKSRMVMTVLQNLVNFDKPVKERLPYQLLDSVLHEEFTGKGVDIPYEFGVVDTRNYNLIYDKKVSDKASLLRNGFRVKLFPNDELAPESYLYVHFPESDKYLRSNMLTVLGSSVVLLLTVSLCFGFAVSIILRQKKLSEIKSDFVNNMTHEFKTPVSTISLACEVLSESEMSENKEILARYVQIIKEENDRLGAQVEKVLQIARLEKGDFKLRIQEVDIHQIILKTVSHIAIRTEKRNGTLHTDLTAEPSVLEGDEMHLTNIISNLLDNADKYSPESPEISLFTENTDKGIIITISDKGRGIAKDTINKVFDKFYRVPTGNVHDVKGFGLGLSYVKTMVHAHNGSISVESEPEKGSTFYIFLPYRHEGN